MIARKSFIHLFRVVCVALVCSPPPAVVGLFAASPSLATAGGERLRIIVETDAGGDPDDEQSLVRFLLYSNEWDIEGIIANRPEARRPENRNPEGTGLGVVRAMLRAYGECHGNLALHDGRYPALDYLWQRTVSGYADSDAGVELIIAAVDRPDPRPIWFMNWGTDHGSAESSLKRALDRIRSTRGEEGYAKFKDHLRLSSDDRFGDHTWKIAPAFRLWVDTLRPDLEGGGIPRQPWYFRFSALTAHAGCFDLERDVRDGHGPLGALYPTNTNVRGVSLPQKEGDTMMFLYLVPTGMNDPDEPTWGSWAGRYGLRDDAGERAYYWATGMDDWHGTTHRDNSLQRWAVDLQNDFKARMDWCVNDFAGANHPPIVRVQGSLRREVVAGERVGLDAADSSDPDGQALRFAWSHHPEPGSYRGSAVAIANADSAQASFIAPEVSVPQSLHVVLKVTDSGEPALARYARMIITVRPR